MLENLNSNPTAVIGHRYDMVYLYDVANGNPNGDPDGDNAPRVDIETGHGLVTDVCLKRKVRNFVRIAKEDQPPFDIYVKERGILANEQKKAYLSLGEEASDRPNIRAREWMCRNFYDVRTFGAVMTTGKAPADEEEGKKKGAKVRMWNCGQVRGPAQLTFSRSIDPIFSTSHTITRTALTNADDTRFEQNADDGDEKAASGQMGRKHTVAYGLYRAHIFLAPMLARDTGFTNQDLLLFVDALKGMFDVDRSAARGEMSAQGLCVFEHTNALGNAPAHKLFEKVQIAPQPLARAFDPARVAAPANGEETMPGVRCWRLL